MVQLSRRLRAAADLVESRAVLADVGTDHALLPAWLCENGRVARAIAMDIRTGPLERARETLRREGLEDRITLRLSDGLEKLSAGEAQSIVIAGMGGMLIRDILRRCPDRAASSLELILGPQSDADQVRREIASLSFCIDRENFILEDGKYYPLLHAVPAQEKPVYTEEELCFGPCLLRDKDPVLRQYLQHRMDRTGEILSELQRHSTDASIRRREELREEERLLQAALDRYEM